mgnify:CR=1 FL=1
MPVLVGGHGEPAVHPRVGEPEVFKPFLGNNFCGDFPESDGMYVWSALIVNLLGKEK